MFKEFADRDTIIAIYEGFHEDFEQALQRCLELFGDECADLADRGIMFRQEFAHEN